MQNFDGAYAMSGHISGVQALVREDYPSSLKFRFMSVYLFYPFVRVFFANIADFRTFSSRSPRRKSLLYSNGIDIPKLGETRWYYCSCVISVLSDKYKVVLELLEKTTESLQDWNDTSLSQASGLYYFMNSFLFCFLVQVFNRILE